jgi:hypothetical protein
MANALKVLGQFTSGATGSLQTLYTVPGATSTTISSIAVCNQNNSVIAFSVTINSVVLAKGDQYLYGGNVAGGLELSGPNTFTATLGITLATGDVVKVQTDTTNVTFQLFGVEVS